MASNKPLADDLAVLAAERRSRLGGPPTAEQLIALRDGELPEEEADRIRDQLAVDPEWAAIYLDLRRASRVEGAVAEGQVPDAEVHKAWETLSPKLDREDPSATDSERALVVPLRRAAWSLRETVLGLAAVLIVAVGLIWMLGRERPETLPEGTYYEVRFDSVAYRDGLRVEVPRDAVGLAFRIDVSGVGPAREVDVELLDASDSVVRKETLVIASGQRQVVFKVAAASLRSGGTYRLVVQSSGPSSESHVMVFVPWIR